MQWAPLGPSPVARECSRSVRTSARLKARNGLAAGVSVISKCLESSGCRGTSEIIVGLASDGCALDVSWTCGNIFVAYASALDQDPACLPASRPFGQLQDGRQPAVSHSLRGESPDSGARGR